MMALDWHQRCLLGANFGTPQGILYPPQGISYGHAFQGQTWHASPFFVTEAIFQNLQTPCRITRYGTSYRHSFQTGTGIWRFPSSCIPLAKAGSLLPSSAFHYKVTFGGGLALELRGGALIPHIPINIHIPAREPDRIRLQKPPQLR